MAQTTTNYGLLKPESTDNYNHLVYDNPNMDTIDAAMKANADAAITTATCIKSGTTHTITRTNTDANVFKFTATGDWNTGDTMTVDGVTVSPFLVTGEALKSGAYLINTEVLASISGTRVTIYSNQSDAAGVAYDDSTVLLAATNVQTGLDNAQKATGTQFSGTQSVYDKINSMQTWTAIAENVPYNTWTDISGALYKEYLVLVNFTDGGDTYLLSETLHRGINLTINERLHVLGGFATTAYGTRVLFTASSARIKLDSVYNNTTNISSVAYINIYGRNAL